MAARAEWAEGKRRADATCIRVVDCAESLRKHGKDLDGGRRRNHGLRPVEELIVGIFGVVG
jgi:hypothetical protein